MEFQLRGMPDGQLSFGVHGREKLRLFLRNYPHGVPMTLTASLPESSKLRRFYEGAVIPLATFYQEGMNHHDPDDRRKMREWLKQEFNGEIILVDGKRHRVAKSSKGRDALNPLVERVINWLQDNYDPPPQALDPQAYKDWRDTVL